MTAPSLRRIVVVGGSIAAVTTVEALRADGFDGDITLVSDEPHAPYSRVPLSKQVLGGKETPASAALPAIGDDVTVCLNSRAIRLRTEARRVVLASGEDVPYDGLVIATGARARRLAAPDQAGEHVLRTLDDATHLASRLRGAGSVVVIGAGFLGMEIASTCANLGLSVTVVYRDPPLRRLLGTWLANLVVEAALDRGVQFVRATQDVKLLGQRQISGVGCGHRTLTPDLVISAVGDLPNCEWLTDSGLPLDGGLVVDPRCRVSSHIVAAGDVTTSRLDDTVHRRSPYWTSAVTQGRAAASTLLRGDNAPTLRMDPYLWTEQFGLNIKVSGEPSDAVPTLLAGALANRSALLQWHQGGRPVAAASVNHRMPIIKLKKLGAHAPMAL